MHRTQPVLLASYVPESALGYLELNDWPHLIEQLTTTKAWRELAPVYGLAGKLDYVGKLGWLAQLTGVGETAMLARSQFAVVVTGLEVRGEEIKPRLALIVETHSKAAALREVIEQRAPALAEKAFGQTVKETGDYNGVALLGYRAAKSERRLWAAQIEGELIVANHLDPLRACIDARQGRVPTMANNFYWQNARASVGTGTSLSGFVTSDGVTRLVRFGAFLMAGGAVGKALLAGAMGEVFTEFTSRNTDGIAYGASFENGEIVDRYALLFKPDLADAVKKIVKVNAIEPQSFAFIPAEAKDVTVLNIVNPTQTMDGIETAIAARVGVGQSFLLRQFLLSAREVFFGLKTGGDAAKIIGDELASFGFSKEFEDRVWLIAARDRVQLLRATERLIASQGTPLVRLRHEGVEVIAATDPKKAAAAFVGNFLAIGARTALLRLLDSQHKGQSLKGSSQLARASQFTWQPAMRGLTAVNEESHEMMAALARLLTGTGATMATQGLPLAVSATSPDERGVFIESHSSFGHFPFFVSLIEGITENATTKH